MIDSISAVFEDITANGAQHISSHRVCNDADADTDADEDANALLPSEGLTTAGFALRGPKPVLALLLALGKILFLRSNGMSEPSDESELTATFFNSAESDIVFDGLRKRCCGVIVVTLWFCDEVQDS
jgi:hypothetical protein